MYAIRSYYAQQVMDDLKWLGIEWDQGPGVGGPHGPYLQSQRKDIYDKYVNKLLDEGKAYYCFDTSEELDALRKQAETQKEGFAYSRPETFPTAEEAEKARADGLPVTVRFAAPQDEPVVVQDIVRGAITFAAGEIGDFIIQKSVITSYSIHYTKLYDPPSFRTGAQSGPAFYFRSRLPERV